jgi:hypothetical protein
MNRVCAKPLGRRMEYVGWEDLFAGEEIWPTCLQLRNLGNWTGMTLVVPVRVIGKPHVSDTVSSGSGEDTILTSWYIHMTGVWHWALLRRPGQVKNGLGTTELSARSNLSHHLQELFLKRKSVSTTGLGGWHTLSMTLYSTATTCNQVWEDVTAGSQAFQPQRNKLPL